MTTTTKISIQHAQWADKLLRDGGYRYAIAAQHSPGYQHLRISRRGVKALKAAGVALTTEAGR